MSYDAIQLIASLKDQPSHSSDLLVEYVLEINGQAIHEEFWVDLFELAKSCQLDGEFDIFTCSCGVAGCAGIFEGITVTHSPDEITWVCPDPIAVRIGSSDDVEGHVKDTRRFRFDPVQYVEAINSGLREIKRRRTSR